MATFTLDLDQIDVSTFEISPGAAIGVRESDDSMSCGCDTSDEICYALSLLAEDCFGPSAGCTIDTQEA